MQNLLKNWKTTSAGVLSILTSIIHLVYAYRAGSADEGTWTTAVTGILVGVGLLFAGDSATSAQAHEESSAAIADLQNKVDVTAKAVVTGDTSMITKAQVPTPKP